MSWSSPVLLCVFIVMFFVCTDSGCVGKSFVKASSKQIIGLRKLIVVDVAGPPSSSGDTARLVMGTILSTSSIVVNLIKTKNYLNISVTCCAAVTCCWVTLQATCNIRAVCC
ncbi:unnamed protein product [Spodoptera littoralis]|uniref:Secreted protein n=1 Tax=Spodoptera littoralis TaxID=7109 RepID=A0A9P0HXK4_SPOLI|nr:unnamed protein product [Spodoptera littoralis]CAH1636253.1 unnamed protein product [Spodoptera littoralis]